VLPTSIADMPELRALTVARNPLVFPPPEICNYDPNLDDMELWVGQLKEYMRSKATTYDGNESGLLTRYDPHYTQKLTTVTKKQSLVPLAREGRLGEVTVWIQILLRCPPSHLPHALNHPTRPSPLDLHLNSSYHSHRHPSPPKTSTG
jgi:hypothetical protein